MVAAAIAASTSDLAHHLQQVQAWAGQLGAWGPAVFVAVYVAATLVAVPGTPFTLTAPLIFGPWPAFAVMVVASSLSASAAFLIARYVARETFARALHGNPVLARIEQLLDDHAWLIIPFVRVVPFPFALSNYGLGLTSLSYWRYLGWSEVGMVPMNALFVFGTYSVLGGQQVAWPHLALVAGAAIAVLTLAFAGRRVWGGAATLSRGTARTPGRAGSGG